MVTNDMHLRKIDCCEDENEEKIKQPPEYIERDQKVRRISSTRKGA